MFIEGRKQKEGREGRMEEGKKEDGVAGFPELW